MRQLPGIAFETVPPPRTDTLPRMDIAAFVGFAEAGPLDEPVPIEDLARFRDIFGSDVPLAWDPERKRVQYGLLGAAVEAFFDNGGRRCHVVRIAQAPQWQRFDLPGLRSTNVTLPNPTRVRARSPGRWAQALQVGTTLLPHPLALPDQPSSRATISLSDDNDGLSRVQIDVAAAPGSLAVGDLIELFYYRVGLLLFVTVDKIEMIDRGIRVSAAKVEGESTWRWALAKDSFSPDREDARRSACLELLDDSVGIAEWRDLPASDRAVRLRRLTFEITVWREERLAARIGALAFCPRHPRFFGNLPSDEALFGKPIQLRPDHRNTEYEALLREASGERGPPGAGRGRRFPVAGPWEPRLDVRWPLVLPDAMDLTRAVPGTPQPLPLGAADALVKDGLAELSPAPFFDERLQDYSGESLLRSAEGMHNRARDWDQRPQGTRPQRLRGLHALLPIQEVTLVAVPDAVHRPWSTDPAPTRTPMPAPWFRPVDRLNEASGLRLSWDAVMDATGYRLEWDVSPDFDTAEPAFEGAATSTRFALSATCSHAVYFRVRAQRYGEPSAWSSTVVYRVRPDSLLSCDRTILPELLLFEIEGWPPSNQTLIGWLVQPGAFQHSPGARFRVEAADDALFLSARTVTETAAMQLRLPPVRTGRTYYRVRTLLDDITGPSSNTLYFNPTDAGRPTLQPSTKASDGDISLPGQQSSDNLFDDDVLLSVHRALLRFCAARGNLLALLCLPHHFGAPEVLDYLAALTPDDSASERGLDRARPGKMPLTMGEAPALSYGALYHPWIARAGAVDVRRDVEVVPPDGTVAGQLAHTALIRGAWVSGANLPLSGVLALEPLLTDPQRRQLTRLQVNLLYRDPRGFVLTNDETLSRSGDVRPVNVRRLLILLKRLALREGTAYLFEPLTSDFSDRVRYRFQRLLSNLHLRGAFQGESAAAAFRVVVDASINPSSSTDAGRFMVELRVAPSRPLTFLRVRLIQNGAQALGVGEI